MVGVRMTDIMTPAFGESVTEATVARWTKHAGDPVKRDELLVELETDKVSLEVVAPEDGILSGIDAEEGATVVPGQRLGRVEAGGADRPVGPVETSTPGAPAARPAPPPSQLSPPPTPIPPAPPAGRPLSPSV